MNKIYHIEFKSASEDKKHFYYGDLAVLFKNHDVGNSIHTLRQYDFELPWENEICIIRRGEVVKSTRSVK